VALAVVVLLACLHGNLLLTTATFGCDGLGFVTREDVPDGIGDFLARFFGLPRDRIFVDNEDRQDDWDWDALRMSLANCQYRRLTESLSCCLSISAHYESKWLDPPERELAERVARELGTVVLFSEGTDIPSVENLVTPDGRLLLARFNEAIDGVAEVSAPVSEIPDAVVAYFEDVVWGWRIAHPVADRFFPQQGELEPSGHVGTADSPHGGELASHRLVQRIDVRGRL
jgi:hypothetical protein